MSMTVAATVSGSEPEGMPGSRVGALIRGHRLRIGMTQRQLADLSTISVRAIRNLEQGKARRPHTETVRLVADALRLGPRARAALETAAASGRTAWSTVKRGFDTRPVPPPAAPHPLVGREGPAGVLTAELADGRERLVHVVGLSGVGKTRLVLEVARRLHADSAVPVLWHTFPGAPSGLPDASAEDLADLVAACASRLCGTPDADVRDEDGDADDGVAALAELVGDRPALLVLDGAPAGPPRTGPLTRLLHECPRLAIAVTSARPWGLPAERVFLLGPLDVPAEDADDAADGPAEDLADGTARTAAQDPARPGDPAASPAVRLFLDRVRRVRPELVPGPEELAVAGAICRRLDGHPAALETAASWLAVCDLGTLHGYLEDRSAPLLDHLADDGDGGRYFREALHRGVARLEDGSRALLAALCSAPEGSFALEDVGALTGARLADCGRMVRDLLVFGAIRPVQEAGRSRFRLLHLVRAFHTEP